MESCRCSVLPRGVVSSARGRTYPASRLDSCWDSGGRAPPCAHQLALCCCAPRGEPVLCGPLGFCVEDGCLPTSVAPARSASQILGHAGPFSRLCRHAPRLFFPSFCRSSRPRSPQRCPCGCLIR